MLAYDNEFRQLYARERAERLSGDMRSPSVMRGESRRLLQGKLPLLSPARRRLASLLPSS